MEYLIVLNVIAISVALAFWITPAKKNNTSNRKNITSIKNCPRCSAEIDADGIKCKSCGSLIDVFSKNKNRSDAH